MGKCVWEVSLMLACFFRFFSMTAFGQGTGLYICACIYVYMTCYVLYSRRLKMTYLKYSVQKNYMDPRKYLMHHWHFKSFNVSKGNLKVWFCICSLHFGQKLNLELLNCWDTWIIEVNHSLSSHTKRWLGKKTWWQQYC